MNNVLLNPRRSHVRRFHRVKRAFWSMAGSVSLGGLYGGQICPSWIRFSQMDMHLPGLGEPFVGKRLVHISDLHCSPLVLDRYLVQLLEHVGALKPDFLVVTGDMITGGTNYARRIAELLGNIPASIAKVACPGNHDYGVYHPAGKGLMRNLLGYLHRRLFDAGVHLLANRHGIFKLDGHPLQFIGLHDLWTPYYNPGPAFEDAEKDMPTICLAHNPDAMDDIVTFDQPHWVLAGHTHGNGVEDKRLRDAIFPFESDRYIGGYFRIGGKHLYVNRGLSYGRRFNLNSRPEITIFTLQQA